jgi:hypothetical protein
LVFYGILIFAPSSNCDLSSVPGTGAIFFLHNAKCDFLSDRRAESIFVNFKAYVAPSAFESSAPAQFITIGAERESVWRGFAEFRRSYFSTGVCRSYTFCVKSFEILNFSSVFLCGECDFSSFSVYFIDFS